MFDKADKLKVIILQLVNENDYIKNAIQTHVQNRITVDMSCFKGSELWPDRLTVYVSLKDLIYTYNIARDLNVENYISSNSKTNQQNRNCNYSAYSDCISVYVETGCEQEINCLLKETEFLNCKNRTIYDSIVIQSLAYTLFHEIGHIVKDEQEHNHCFFAKEVIADYFAFRALKASCNSTQEDSDIILYGTLLALTQILLSRNNEEELADLEHPHSIERIFALFRFWPVTDSCTWKLAYKIISEWIQNNGIKLSHENECDVSFEQKCFEAYKQISDKKIPQILI